MLKEFGREININYQTVGPLLMIFNPNLQPLSGHEPSAQRKVPENYKWRSRISIPVYICSNP
jgi:hypothetical protein